jgi:hypothetical protein
MTQDPTSSSPTSDPIAQAILDCVADGPKSPQDVARFFAATRAKASDPRDVWRRYLPAVKNQMVHLARSGRIEIVRKGEVVDPKDFRGIVKLRLAGNSP